MACVQTFDLSHRYGGQLVLDRVSITVPEASIYGFLGPNGAGKSTTLRLLLDLLPAPAGAIRIFDRPLERDRLAILRQVGSLIESPSAYDHLTAHENLRILQQVHRCPDARIEEVLDLVGLAHVGRKRFGAFSLGMKQRLGIAAALLPSPRLLILDEPTNGLDPAGIIEMRELLVRLNREQGVTLIVSSHLLAEIERLATHVGILHRGRLVFEGPLSALRARRARASGVRIGTSDANAAEALLRAAVPSLERDGDTLVLPTLPEPTRALVNRMLVTGGVDVHELTPVGADLESIFMNLLTEADA